MQNIIYNKIHFIGIGGIGMSALARYYKSQGIIISGSDSSESELIDNLRSEGIIVNISESSDNVADDTDLLVYTIAIKSDNVELLKGLELANNNEKSCRVLTYPQALGEMSREKKVIAVCGTHGKTTTTAMVYYALQNTGLDVSMILGSLIKDKNSENKMTNYIQGNSDWIVIEACEYRRSFLNYNPEIILITNIDADHLDYYKDIGDIENAFGEFIDRLSENGKVIIHKNEEAVISRIQENYREKNKLENNNFKIEKSIKKVICEDVINLEDVKLSVPGEHNRKNAQLVVALGDMLGLSREKVLEGLKNFAGTWRRQEYKGKHFDMECYDDYAHHPSEIKATLQAFKEKCPNKKIIACFMPHLYSRTKILFDDFINSFDDADEIILLPIYAAREQVDISISSDMLARELNNINKKAVSLASVNTLKDYLKIHSDKNNVVVTMGAGDIYKLYE